jgi:DNA-binding response OmpR family regulator
MNNPARDVVILVEKDKDLRRVISASLTQMGMLVLEACDDQEARRILEKDHAKILIIEHDWSLEKNTGVIEAFRKQRGSETAPVLVTTRNRLDDGWREQQKPIIVLYKPFDVRYLCRLINRLQEQNPRGTRDVFLQGVKDDR